MRELIIKTEGTTEPVSQSELTSFVGYLGSDATTTAMIESLGLSARLRLEQYTGRNFVEKTMTFALDSVGINVPLPMGPISSIDSVEVYDVYGVLDDTLTADDDYYLVGEFDKYLKLESWFHGAYIKIEYKAGYKAAGYPLPEALKNAIKMQAKHDFDNRGRYDTDTIISEVKNMVLPYRCSFL